MIRTKDELKRYIEYETRNFDHPILLKIPVDLYESQIIARYLILLRKTEYHINCGHKIRKIFYLLRLKRKQCRYGIHIPVNVFDKGLLFYRLARKRNDSFNFAIVAWGIYGITEVHGLNVYMLFVILLVNELFENSRHVEMECREREGVQKSI